jgi:hypothetical protein
VRNLSDLFVLLQPKVDEGVGGDRTGEGIKTGIDSMWTETSMRGTSTAETAGDDTEANVNVSVEALTAYAATVPEV